jgi:hypothetical protein
VTGVSESRYMKYLGSFKYDSDAESADSADE